MPIIYKALRLLCNFFSEGTSSAHCSSDERTLLHAKSALSSKNSKNQAKKNLRLSLLKIFPFLGPAFVASVAYVDPGNFATNIHGGSKYGYLLLWVIFVSNLMAMLVQALSAKLGIATGQNLAEICRKRLHPALVLIMWFVAELIAIVTDMAEFLGAALGFNLLFGIPLWIGAILTALVSLIILGFERYGFRPLEFVISIFVGVIALCYLIEILLSKIDWWKVAYHSVVPMFSGKESVIVASGILGATVMPHVIFLHSALTQGRIVTKDPVKLKKLYKFQLIDVTIALGLAGLINASMLIMAASAFNSAGYHNVGTIEEAHLTLAPLLGKASSWIFAISLLASGLSSSTVGTMSGQVVMKGFLDRKIPLLLRRLITMCPALIPIVYGMDPTQTLVISQVVLSFGIPFAVIPLMVFTSNREIMGVLVNNKLTMILGTLVAILIISLNFFLIFFAI